jgi:hypothetical protein
MEVKSGEGTVVVADHNRYSDECCNNRGWGSGWGAVGGALVGGAQRDQNIINSVVQALGNKTA